MIITLNGPAGAGKGTLARMLANHLGLPHYDFGLLFRAIAHVNLQIQHIQMENGRILFEGLDLTDILRTEEVGLHAAKMTCNLKKLAISLVMHADFICDGRTCGTEIFPDADHKFYITASKEERFNRRFQTGGNREIMLQREMIDEARLVIPVNAIVIDTTGKSKEESFKEVLSYF